MKRTAVQLVLAAATIGGGVFAFLAGYFLASIGLVFVGWVILGSLVVRGAPMTPGEGGPPPGVGPP